VAKIDFKIILEFLLVQPQILKIGQEGK